MRDFACPHCGQRLAFEASVCLSCSTGVGSGLDLLVVDDQAAHGLHTS